MIYHLTPVLNYKVNSCIIKQTMNNSIIKNASYFIILALSLVLNLVQILIFQKNERLVEKRETPIVKNNCENGNNTKNSSQNGYHKTKQTLVVYVKPHPPTFHNGRYINYNDYYVIEVGSKKKSSLQKNI